MEKSANSEYLKYAWIPDGQQIQSYVAPCSFNNSGNTPDMPIGIPCRVYLSLTIKADRYR